MKITGIRIDKKTIAFESRYKNESRSCGPLDMYQEFATDAKVKNMRAASDQENGYRSALFLYVTTDEGLEGQFGPIENRAEALTVMDGIERLLIGKDPLENIMLWDLISRFDRHSRSGVMMMAISAVDIALWDLKGKILNLPVYKLMGGGRAKVRPYISMLGFSVEPEKVKQRALMVRDMGITAQKWFFRYGPSDGAEGVRKNLDMAFALREALGDDYELMFDCWMGWTIRYARMVFRELERVHPVWVEEVLRPHMVDGYRNLKSETSIPLSAGEHFYTRMEVNQYLKDQSLDVMQSDPAWCGGITEARRIGDLCEMYGTTFIPHGTTLMPAVHTVASMPSEITPYCEYLLHYMDTKTAFFRENRLTNDGWIVLNDTPGLGEEIDESRVVKTETIHTLSF